MTVGFGRLPSLSIQGFLKVRTKLTHHILYWLPYLVCTLVVPYGGSTCRVTFCFISMRYGAALA